MTTYEISDPADGGVYAGYWSIEIVEDDELLAAYHIAPEIAQDAGLGLLEAVKPRLEDELQALADALDIDLSESNEGGSVNEAFGVGAEDDDLLG
ncbi:hypothetical protein [Haloarchaeobius sp. TZWSO28]|uniref:hypothetical protein n=1 Tax=Haloarchaeobius sp. TZWSO28 TaxID=3446119 RepID=UPI003EB8E3FF